MQVEPTTVDFVPAEAAHDAAAFEAHVDEACLAVVAQHEAQLPWMIGALEPAQASALRLLQRHHLGLGLSDCFCGEQLVGVGARREIDLEHDHGVMMQQIPAFARTKAPGSFRGPGPRDLRSLFRHRALTISAGIPGPGSR